MQTAVQTDFLSCIQVSTVQLHSSTGKIFPECSLLFSVATVIPHAQNTVAHFHFKYYIEVTEAYVK